MNECPKYLSRRPTIADHSIYFPEDDDYDQGYRIPLQLHGTISYLPTPISNKEDLIELPQFNLTPNTPEWNPHTEVYGNQEHSMLNYQGELVERKSHDRELFGIDSCTMIGNEEIDCVDMNISEVLTFINPNYCPEQFTYNLSNHRYDVSSVASGNRKGVTAKKLDERWMISPKLVQQTIDGTTQLCILSSGIPSLSRRFKANDRMLRYPRINVNVFTDTFFATKKKKFTSTRGNTCCQLFVTEHNYVAVRLMKTRKDGFPQALKSFFKEVGVPPALIADGAKEQVQGESRKICQQVGYEIRELEQGTPSSNRAERYVGI